MKERIVRRGVKRPARFVIGLVALLLVLAGATRWTGGRVQTAEAASPMTGSKAWAVVLCMVKGTTVQPETPAWFEDFFAHSAPNKDGLWDYWHDMSYGKLDLNGSQVFGWNTMPHDQSYYAGLPQAEKRPTWISDCANTATGVDFSRFYGVLAIANQKIGMGAVGIGPQLMLINGKLGRWGEVMIDPPSFDVAAVAHETGHAFGLDHSFDTKNTSSPCASGDSRPGAYCDKFDIMSYANSYSFTDGNMGYWTADFSGPGLVAANRDGLGWIPSATVVDPGAGTKDVQVSPLETGPNMIKVPIGDSPQHYYTVEYRDPSLGYSGGTKWDQAIPNATVLIHEVRTNGLVYLVDTGGGPLFNTLCQKFSGLNNIYFSIVSWPGPWSGSVPVIRVGHTGDGVPAPAGCGDTGGAKVGSAGDGGGFVPYGGCPLVAPGGISTCAGGNNPLPGVPSSEPNPNTVQ